MRSIDDPILKRFRSTLDKIYGQRLERVVLYGSRAAMRGRIPTMTLRCFCATCPPASPNYIGWPTSAPPFSKAAVISVGYLWLRYFAFS